MDGRYIEPRKVMWAMAEITWENDSGTSFRVPAILEDTSTSGACIRIKRPVAIGSRLNIKWHREEFPAIARNCRRDGGDFLLGVLREAEILSATQATGYHAVPDAKSGKPAENPAEAKDVDAAPPQTSLPGPVRLLEPAPAVRPTQSVQSRRAFTGVVETSPPRPQREIHNQGTSPRPERKVMQPKTIFPHFWRRKQDEDAPAKSGIMEAPVNKPITPEQTPSGPRGELLNYDDIYRAVGIMSPGSGYGIHKVVDMLNNDRIRDLSRDAKRASVLMALDAAGISADELLTDATRRQNALTAYEAGQVKQLEDFETRKGKENARIEDEMEKVRAHYAQRVQANLDQVVKEKETLHNWQMAMQHETQRIAEVIDLCGKQALSSPARRPPPVLSAPGQSSRAMAVAAGAGSSEKSEPAPADTSHASPARPTVLGGTKA
jgi:hypothetical protein